jgi:hypothetical protein
MIMPGTAGLKSRHDLASHWGYTGPLVEDGGLEWDVATLAVHREYQGAAKAGAVSMSLVQGITMCLATCDVRALLMILDVVVLRHLQGSLCRPFTSIPGVASAPYLGSKSSKPVYCDVASWMTSVREKDPDLASFLYEGTGREAMMAPPNWVEVADIYRSAMTDGSQQAYGLVSTGKSTP